MSLADRAPTGRAFLWNCSTLQLLSRLRRRFHRIDDRMVAGAAAVIAGEMLANLVAVRVKILHKDILCRHQHAGRAVAALERVALAKCRLKIGNLAAVGQSLD